MSIKYNFVFHVSDDTPKVVIIYGGGFFLLLCVVILWAGNTFSVDKVFLCEMKAPSSRNVVGLNQIWSLVSCIKSSFFIHPSLLDVLSNVPLSDSNSRMSWAFFSVLIMSNCKSSFSWAISCHKLIWNDFRNKGNVDSVYPAWRFLLCQFIVCYEHSWCLTSLNWKGKAKKTWEFSSRSARCSGLRSIRKIKGCLDSNCFFNGACYQKWHSPVLSMSI